MSLDLSETYRIHRVVSNIVKARCASIVALSTPHYVTLEDHYLSEDKETVVAVANLWWEQDYISKSFEFSAAEIIEETCLDLGRSYE